MKLPARWGNSRWTGTTPCLAARRRQRRNIWLLPCVHQMTEHHMYIRAAHKHRGYRTPLLYLDFDGVLHPEDVWRTPGRGIHLSPGFSSHTLFENAHLLAQALEPFPDVRIILSTTWVRVLGYTGAAVHLPSGVRNRVVGATFHSQMPRQWWQSLSRAQQVLSDVGRREPSAWVAVDDDATDWPDTTREHFVASDPVLGLSSPEVWAKFQTALKKNFAPDEDNGRLPS